MPGPLLTTLPQSPYAGAYDAVVDLLRSNAVLHEAGVKIWPVYQNDNACPAITPIPHTSDMPLIRVSTGSFPMATWAEAYHRATMRFQFEMWTAGRHPDDSLNLFDAVFGALKPTDNTEIQAVKDALDVANRGIIKAEFRAGSAAMSPQRQAQDCLRAVAEYELTFLRQG